MMRITWPRVLGVAFVAALFAYAFVFAPQVTRPVAHQVTRPVSTQDPTVQIEAGPPQPFPATGKKFLGIMTSTRPTDWSTLNAFTDAVDVQPSVYEFSQGWAVNQFNKAALDQVAAKGMLPFISWEPWNFDDTAPGAQTEGDQPAYKLSNIIDGRFDKYIKSWAEGVKGLPYTVAIRFAHEMNGNWYPWGMQDLNKNTPAQYVAAWRHVHDIFTEVGATNVIWVWSPNVAYAGSSPLAALYPGNKYVDWVGLSGYYGTPGLDTYVSFNGIFDQTLKQLKAITDKPIVITETGGTNTDGDMARYVTQMFQQLPTDHANIIGVIWYEAIKGGVDWRLTTHPAAASSFTKAVAHDPLYDTSWKPGMIPLETVPQPVAHKKAVSLPHVGGDGEGQQPGLGGAGRGP
jgi:hypothetical protein